MKAIIESKLIDGKPAHRFEDSPEGAWHVADSSIDAIIDHVMSDLGVKRIEVYNAMGATYPSISRCRTGDLAIQDKWILRLHQFTNIPVAELLRVACVQRTVSPHSNARRSA